MNRDKPYFKTDLLLVATLTAYLILIILEMFDIINHSKLIDAYGIAVLGGYLVIRTMRIVKKQK